MLRNYLTVAFRSLTKNRTYAFINIFGLALGIAACLMLLLYVRYELSYDSWLKGSGRVYQLQSKLVTPSGEKLLIQGAAYPVGGALKKDFPQIDKLVRMQYGSATILHRAEARKTEGLLFVDGPVFDILALPFASGDPATALARPGSMVLTEKVAQSYFGRANPVGRTLTLKGQDGTVTDYRITGVLRDLPGNTHFDFQMLARFDTLSPPADIAGDVTNWNMIGGVAYLTLRPGASVDSVTRGLPAWAKRSVPSDQPAPPGGAPEWGLENVRDIHLGEAEGMKENVERGLIATFGAIALLILALACINFTNLATARATQRAREVALRKMLGASRMQLILQFLGESLLLALISTLLALASVELALPYVSSLIGAELTMSYFGPESVLPAIAVLVAVVALAAGLYPAFYLTRFQPARVLKANSSASDPPGTGRLRSALVIGQFAISIGLIACTAIVYSQTIYARTVDPGFRRDGLIQVSGLRDLGPAGEAFAREAARIEGVTAVGRTMIGVSTGMISIMAVEQPGQKKPLELGAYAVEPAFFGAMGIDLLAGRLFDARIPADQASPGGQPGAPGGTENENAPPRRVVINESAARSLGHRTPEAAVGKQFRAGGAPPHLILGVVRDSRFRSVREEVEPIVFRYEPADLPYAVIRYQAGALPRVRKEVEAVWKRFAPDVPFEAELSEEVLGRLYEAEDARGQLFGGFALLAVLIACLGLFGLAAFTAERRTKEIGVRKVFGARVRDIVKLLVWQFSKPVVLANLVAWPAAWWVMRDWLNTFDARIALTPGPFLLAGLIALAIAVGTIAGHAIKVARANPIHALRYE